MDERRRFLSRRNVLRGAVSTAGLGLTGCGSGGPAFPKLIPTKYSDRPAMMAIGDSLYQGVRSLTFVPGMASGSPPAQVAATLGLPFTAPNPPRPILFDLEAIYRSPFPFIAAPFDLGRRVLDNSLRWRLNRIWSEHEAFDNVAIGSAEIASLYTDTYENHWQKFLDKAVEPQVNLMPYKFIAEMWYSLNVCFTLNPRHRDDQRKTTQIDQVSDRKPRLLLVNIGSNEGLFSAAFQGDLKTGADTLKVSLTNMDDLARRLAELPREVETIAFNSLIRPRAATNLMPADGVTRLYPGNDYFDAYGPWLFSDKQPIRGADLKEFDEGVKAQNDQVRSMLQMRLGSRLVFVDLYAKTTEYDGKHYQDRVLKVGSRSLKNLPLSGTSADMGGGLTGLDNMHPSIPGYAIIADAVLEALGKSVRTDKQAAFNKDSLLNGLPPFLAQRHVEVLGLVDTIRRFGSSGFLS